MDPPGLSLLLFVIAAVILRGSCSGNRSPPFRSGATQHVDPQKTIAFEDSVRVGFFDVFRCCDIEVRRECRVVAEMVLEELQIDLYLTTDR